MWLKVKTGFSVWVRRQCHRALSVKLAAPPGGPCSPQGQSDHRNPEQAPSGLGWRGVATCTAKHRRGKVRHFLGDCNPGSLHMPI